VWRFYFDLRGGSSFIADEEGAELADEHAAVAAAVRQARSLLSADILTGTLNLNQEIVVSDAGRRELARVAFEDVIFIAPKAENPVGPTLETS
jgi:hypothetical protein